MNPQYIKTTALSNPNNTRCRIFSVNVFKHPIHTIVTATPAVVRQWVHNIRRNYHSTLSSSSLVVGLGVQWNRPIKGGAPSSAATLQLCIDTDCLIFQLCFPTSAPATLRRFLGDDRITFVGVNNGRDKKILENCRLKLEVCDLVDLAEGRSRYWSMEKMATYFLGADDVVKPIELGLSNWEDFFLTNDQVQYACVDAFISFKLATEAFGYPKHCHVHCLTRMLRTMTMHDEEVVDAKPKFNWLSDDGGNGGVVVVNSNNRDRGELDENDYDHCEAVGLDRFYGCDYDDSRPSGEDLYALNNYW